MGARNTGCEFNPSALYASMEVSQGSPFGLYMLIKILKSACGLWAWGLQLTWRGG
jgi:hypothetical protein